MNTKTISLHLCSIIESMQLISKFRSTPLSAKLIEAFKTLFQCHKQPHQFDENSQKKWKDRIYGARILHDLKSCFFLTFFLTF